MLSVHYDGSVVTISWKCRAKAMTEENFMNKRREQPDFIGVHEPKPLQYCTIWIFKRNPPTVRNNQTIK